MGSRWAARLGGSEGSLGIVDVADLHRALAVSELKLGAALRQIDRLRRREALREAEAGVLKEAARKAQFLVYHDEVTRLPNRHLLRDRFTMAAALADRHEQSAALLFLDLDGFKRVNDTLGHAAGDELLQQVAARVIGSIRASDTACRYGGDEFVVLLTELRSQVEAATVANDIRACLAVPYAIGGAQIAIATSLGVAVYPAEAREYDELLRLADRAMYRDKACRKTLETAEASQTPAEKLRSSASPLLAA
jgi:diguanylate cyclase (GGDEF)-like protein